MASEFQQLKESYEDVLADSLELLEEVRLHTLTARKAMDVDPVDANTLSNEIVELAILNQRLGDRVADAGGIARAAENYYKTIREEHKVRLVTEGIEQDVEVKDTKAKETKTVRKFVKQAAGVADSAKMKLAENEFKFYNQATTLWEKLQFMRRSSDKTIDAIRSKLSFEKTDYKNS